MTHPDIEEQEHCIDLILRELFTNRLLGPPITELVNAAIARQREIYPSGVEDPEWRQKLMLQAMTQIGAGIELLSRGAAITGTIVNAPCYAEGENPDALFARIFVRELAPFLIHATEYDFESEQLRAVRKTIRNASPTAANKGEKL